MTLQTIFDYLTGTQSGVMIVVCVLMSLIEVSKIELNPWSFIARCIQKIIGVRDLADRMDKRDAIDARSRIIRFDDECMNFIKHSKAMFDAVLIDCDTYSDYCRTHPGFKNSIAEDAINHIKELYHKCKLDNDFLVVRRDGGQNVKWKNV